MKSEMKTVIITGANTGLGFETARHLALNRPEWHLVLACRSETKALTAQRKLTGLSGNLNISFFPLDLSSLSSVREFVQLFNTAKLPPLHGIICNAGMSGTDALEFSADGIEKTFQVNYLSHFLLVYLLLPVMEKYGRIIVVSSELHRNDGPMKAFHPNYTSALQLAGPAVTETMIKDSGSQRYSTSKLCQVLYMNMLSKLLASSKYNEISVNAINPGLMPATGLGGLNKKLLRKWFLKYILPFFAKGAVSTPELSGEIIARMIWSDEFEGISGRCFDREKNVPSSAESHDLGKMKDLWDTSLELVSESGRLLEKI